jgi:two-component system, sensor histidine kinase and response regulator
MKKLLQRLLSFGTSGDLRTYKARQIRIFNWFNIYGFLVAIVRLVYMMFSSVEYTALTILVNSLPIFLCLLMGVCMYLKRTILATVISFCLFPSTFFLMYAATLDYSVAMFLLLYFIFPFFFLQKPLHILGSFIFTATSFLLINIGDKFGLLFYKQDFYSFDLTLASINFATSIIFIFICLYSIRGMVFSYQKKLADKKKELKKLNAVKDKLFSIISHDLRSPMASTAQFLDLLKETEMGKEEFDFYLSELKATVDNTREMMDKLLTWSSSQMHDEGVRTESIPVRELVDATILFIRQRADAKNITVLNDVNEHYCAVADRDITGIILHNLLANAVKFTRDGGTVTIHAVKTPEAKLSIRVSDNGVGIPADMQHRVLGNEFYTTIGTAKEKGSGLGLKMCQDLAIKNNAQLCFESVEGKGSIFFLNLPLLRVSIPNSYTEQAVGNLHYAVA